MADANKLVPTLRELRARRNEIITLAQKHGASNIRIVGSVSRGEAARGSDIDLLVTYPPNRSIFDLVELWLEMQELLGYPVNLIPDSASDKAFMASVEQDAVPL